LTPERVFVVLALLSGLGFALASPPLDPADERRHLQRAFALSEGHGSAPGPGAGHRHQVPRSIGALHPPYHFVHRDGSIDRHRGSDGRIVCLHQLDDVLASLRTPLEPSTREQLRKPTTYGPLAYAPQAASLWLGRTLELPAGALLYLARFASLASWIALCWAAVRLAPLRKWTLVVLALMPMSVYAASSVTADAVTNGVALLLLALVLRIAFAEGRVRSPEVLGLIAAASALGIVKQGYWALGALLLLIPATRFRARRRKLELVALAFAGMTACTLAWTLSVRAAQPDVGADMSWADWQELASHFPAWLKALRRHAYPLLAGYVGILGRLDVVLPRWIYTAYPAALIAIALIDGRDPPALTLARRVALVAIFATGALCVLALLFAISPNPRTAAPGMVQGRYFIPLVPLLPLALPAYLRMPPRWGPACVAGFCAVSLGTAVYAVAHHYFVGTPPPG
jgi:hypothetical protein